MKTQLNTVEQQALQSRLSRMGCAGYRGVRVITSTQPPYQPLPVNGASEKEVVAELRRFIGGELRAKPHRHLGVFVAHP